MNPKTKGMRDHTITHNTHLDSRIRLLFGFVGPELRQHLGSEYGQTIAEARHDELEALGRELHAAKVGEWCVVSGVW
jgi:hypothetical protein